MLRYKIVNGACLLQAAVLLVRSFSGREGGMIAEELEASLSEDESKAREQQRENVSFVLANEAEKPPHLSLPPNSASPDTTLILQWKMRRSKKESSIYSLKNSFIFIQHFCTGRKTEAFNLGENFKSKIKPKR